MADEALDDDLLAQAIALSLAEAQAAGEETAPTTSGEKKRAHSPQGGDAAAESSRTPRPRTEARDLASQAAIQPHPRLRSAGAGLDLFKLQKVLFRCLA